MTEAETGMDNKMEETSAPPAEKETQEEQEEPVSKTLFVSNISWRIKRNFLKKKAAEFGSVTDCKIINYFDKAQNRVKSKGYGFVTFSNEEEASKAKKAMDGLELQTRELVVKFATSAGPRTWKKSDLDGEGAEGSKGDPGSYTSLFLKTFPRETTTEEVTKLFTAKGFPEPTQVTTRPLRSSGRLYAVVKFDSHLDAKSVFDLITKEGKELMSGEKKLTVEVFEHRTGNKQKNKEGKKSDADAEEKPKKRLYMKGFSESTTEESLKKKCEEYGEVVKCQLKLSKKPTPTKFAYVNYETADQAAKAKDSMNEMAFEDGTLLVEYAKVRQRSRAARKKDGGKSPVKKKSPAKEKPAEKPAEAAKDATADKK